MALNQIRAVIGNHLLFARKGAAAINALTGLVTTASGDATVTGNGSCKFLTELAAGDSIKIAGVTKAVSSITDDNSLEAASTWGTNATPIAAEVHFTNRSTLKPLATSTNFTELGIVADCGADAKFEAEEVRGPSPGVYRLIDEVPKFVALDLSLTFHEYNELFFESIWQASGAVTNDYSPMQASGQIYGWCKLQQYTQTNALQNVADLWCIMRVKSLKFGQELVKPAVDLKILYNALNSGTGTFTNV